jgi:hypothetical protein
MVEGDGGEVSGMAIANSDRQLSFARCKTHDLPLDVIHSSRRENIIAEVGHRRHDLPFESRKLWHLRRTAGWVRTSPLFDLDASH